LHRTFLERQPAHAAGQPAAINPLDWWRDMLQDANRAPILSPLAPLARMYLAMPAASADLERTFSSAAYLLEGRWRLRPANLEMQVVIRDWILEKARTYPADADLMQYVRQFVEDLMNVELVE
jgi:hypothetical protein